MLRLRRHEGAEVFDIGRTEQNLGRAARAKPDEILQRRMLDIGAAHHGQRRTIEHRVHGVPPCFARAPSNPAAQFVIEPAPRNTIAPPDFAQGAMMAGRSSGPSMPTTCLCPCARRPATNASRSMPSMAVSPAA